MQFNCYFALLFCSAILQCHFAVPFCSAILQCHFATQFCTAILHCYFEKRLLTPENASVFDIGVREMKAPCKNALQNQTCKLIINIKAPSKEH
jgi:hypothetical protein